MAWLDINSGSACCCFCWVKCSNSAKLRGACVHLAWMAWRTKSLVRFTWWKSDFFWNTKKDKKEMNLRLQQQDKQAARTKIKNTHKSQQKTNPPRKILVSAFAFNCAAQTSQKNRKWQDISKFLVPLFQLQHNPENPLCFESCLEASFSFVPFLRFPSGLWPSKICSSFAKRPRSSDRDEISIFTSWRGQWHSATLDRFWLFEIFFKDGGLVSHSWVWNALNIFISKKFVHFIHFSNLTLWIRWSRSLARATLWNPARLFAFSTVRSETNSARLEGTSVSWLAQNDWKDCCLWALFWFMNVNSKQKHRNIVWSV